MEHPDDELNRKSEKRFNEIIDILLNKCNEHEVKQKEYANKINEYEVKQKEYIDRIDKYIIKQREHLVKSTIFIQKILKYDNIIEGLLLKIQHLNVRIQNLKKN